MEYSDFLIDTLCPFLITITTSTLLYLLCVEAKRELYRFLGPLMFSFEEINNNPKKLEYYLKVIERKKNI